MIKNLKKILQEKKNDITDEQTEKILRDILAVLLLEIVGKSEIKMNSEEVANIKSLFRDKQYEKIMEIVQKKYTDEEWEELVKEEAEKLLDDYFKNVIER